MSIKTAFQSAKKMTSRAIVGSCLLATGAYAAEFTDQVRNAKAIDTRAMRDSTKTGADNFGFMIGLGSMVVGLVFAIWGIIWVMKASRSEGRTSATAGWIMLIGGGALGAITAIFMFLTGMFSGISS